jgi:hypothetical protein
MKSISPGLEKISQMISSKTGSSSMGNSNKGMLPNKKKKHLKFNFMKSPKV